MDGGQRRTETGTRSRMERVSRVEPAAVRRAGGERSAQHRFPRGAAGIDKGSAAASLVPFTAPVIKSATRRLVNGTLPRMPHASPIAGWRLKLIRPTGYLRRYFSGNSGTGRLSSIKWRTVNIGCRQNIRGPAQRITCFISSRFAG